MAAPVNPKSGRGKVGVTYQDSEPWWPTPTAAAAGDPDVVVIVLDDVGFGSIGCYGSEIDTPVIDRLARQGLQYTNFHATPLCSATRASLVTGRNHHSVGMSLLSNADSGFPSKRGAVTNRAAMISEMLVDSGYSTMAIGKWHLAPLDQTTSVGPFDQWPLGRGFERYYGFLEGITDQFYPELVQDNQRIPTPKTPEEGYHLSEDLVDQAISYVTDQKSLAPDKPYFMYLAFGAAHTPHQAPDEYLQKYRGRYDEGWDVIRERRLVKQRSTGVVPPGTELAPRNEGVQPWADLTATEQKVMARMQEAFAAMLEHTDAQIGRFIDHLEALGVRENTLIVLLSDNGASQEGGLGGTTNTIAFENGDAVSTEHNLDSIDDIGGPRNHSNYPWGWAQAGNTPLKRYKQNTHAGGVRVPMLVNWPASIASEQSGLRHQFHSVIDVAPTILDITGTQAPEVRRGIPQMPVHGTSMVPSFTDAEAPSEHRTQYFEMYGHRALWHDGWKAVAFHQRHTSYDEDRWELYKADEDYSECHDLAAEHPDLLSNLIGRWWSEAERYDVFPLDDRNFAERAAKYHAASSLRRQRQFRFYRGMSMLPGSVTPLIYDRSFDVSAQVSADRTVTGTLLAQGDVNGGQILYAVDGVLHYEYNHQGTRYRVQGELPQGRITELGLRFAKTGELRGTATLTCNGAPIADGEIASTARYLIGWQGLTIGHMSHSPVTWDIKAAGGFPFSGTLSHIDIHLRDDGPWEWHEVID